MDLPGHGECDPKLLVLPYVFCVLLSRFGAHLTKAINDILLKACSNMGISQVK